MMWCECSKPDNEGSPFGMWGCCFRKPHTECRAHLNVHRPEVKSPGGGNDLTASGHQETT